MSTAKLHVEYNDGPEDVIRKFTVALEKIGVSVSQETQGEWEAITLRADCDTEMPRKTNL